MEATAAAATATLSSDPSALEEHDTHFASLVDSLPELTDVPGSSDDTVDAALDVFDLDSATASSLLCGDNQELLETTESESCHSSSDTTSDNARAAVGNTSSNRKRRIAVVTEEPTATAPKSRRRSQWYALQKVRTLVADSVSWVECAAALCGWRDPIGAV